MQYIRSFISQIFTWLGWPARSPKKIGQGEIIDQVNKYVLARLKEKGENDTSSMSINEELEKVGLDVEGVCNGLSTLWAYYFAKGEVDAFYNLIQQATELSSDSQQQDWRSLCFEGKAHAS